VLADRGLAELQVRRGRVKAAVVGHRDQAAQRNDVKDARHFHLSPVEKRS
jgi:hypothetical protein